MTRGGRPLAEIRALVADDEPLARRGVLQLLEPFGEVRVVGEARDGREAVELLRTLRPDLLFLDVQMPELNGFDVLERALVHEVPAVVFLTAYERFALEAFDVDAVDYLLKPVRRARFARCMERVHDRIEQWRLRKGAAGADEDLPRTVVVSVREGERVLRPEEIDWIEADDYYAVIHTGGERHLVRESLASLEERLPAASFLRVHRSALVNLARVRALEEDGEGGTRLALRSGALVPVSRRRRSEVGKRIRGL